MLLGLRVKDYYLPDWILAWKQARPEDAHVPGGGVHCHIQRR